MNLENSVLWLPQYKPCNNCQGGFIIEEGIGRKCKCKIEHDNELFFIQSLLESNLIETFSSEYQYLFLKQYNLETSYKGPDELKNKEKLNRFINRFEQIFNSINLFFYGEPGTQKTTLAKYILVEILKKKKTGYYIIANDLFNILTDSERKEESKEILKNILQVDLLIIDEFDESKITLYSSDWKQKFILPFLKSRLEIIKKSTIFVSNKKPNNLGEKFEGAIQDLIERETENGLFEFKDKYSKYKEKVNIKNIWTDD
jgi:DNA replication protein DnaC